MGWFVKLPLSERGQTDFECSAFHFAPFLKSPNQIFKKYFLRPKHDKRGLVLFEIVAESNLRRKQRI